MNLQAPTLPDAPTDLRQQVHDAARRARVAARTLASLTTADKDRALHAAADAVLAARRPDPGRQRRGPRRPRGPPARPTRCSTGWRSTRSASTASPPGCVRSPGCPTRSARCCAARTLPNGLQTAPAAGPARCGRHRLRGPAQRHRRRVRADAQVGQRGAAARKFVGGAVQRGAGRRCCAARWRLTGLPADAVQLLPSADRCQRHPPDPGPRTGRRGHPARRSRA